MSYFTWRNSLCCMTSLYLLLFPQIFPLRRDRCFCESFPFYSSPAAPTVRSASSLLPPILPTFLSANLSSLLHSTSIASSRFPCILHPLSALIRITLVLIISSCLIDVKFVTFNVPVTHSFRIRSFPVSPHIHHNILISWVLIMSPVTYTTTLNEKNICIFFKLKYVTIFDSHSTRYSRIFYFFNLESLKSPHTYNLSRVTELFILRKFWWLHVSSFVFPPLILNCLLPVQTILASTQNHYRHNNCLHWADISLTI